MTTHRPWPTERAELAASEEFKTRRLADELVDLSVLWRKRYRIVGFAFAAAVAAAAFLMNVTPTYQAASQVMLTTGASEVIDIPNPVPNAPMNDQRVQSEINVIVSPTILQKVVRELDLVEDPEFATWLQEQSWLSEAIGSVRAFIKGLFVSEPPSSGGEVDIVGAVAYSVAGHLTVRPVGISYVIEIGAWSESPETAADIANTVARKYVASQIEAKYRASERAAVFLEGRVDKLRDELIKAEQALEDAKTNAAMQGHSAQMAVELRELQREADASRAVYEQFLVRLKGTRERGTFQDANAEIISLAEVPGSPSAPKKTLLVIVAFVLGGMGSVVVTLVGEARRNTLLSEEDVRRCCSLPVIGNIPAVTDAETPMEVLQWAASRPFSALSEAIRWLRVTLDNTAVRPPRVIVVTSALPREGKSTLAMLLAQNCAASGMNTLLVDADLRRKFVSSAFGLTSSGHHVIEEHGFTVFRIDDIIGGDHRLISNQVFVEVLAAARDSYDATIVDAPPALSVSDVATLCNHADAVIMACRWNQTPRGALELAVRQLRSLGAKICGVALTCVDLKRQATVTFSGAEYALRQSMTYYSDDSPHEGEPSSPGKSRRRMAARTSRREATGGSGTVSIVAAAAAKLGGDGGIPAWHWLRGRVRAALGDGRTTPEAGRATHRSR